MAALWLANRKVRRAPTPLAVTVELAPLGLSSPESWLASTFLERDLLPQSRRASKASVEPRRSSKLSKGSKQEGHRGEEEVQDSDDEGRPPRTPLPAEPEEPLDGATESGLLLVLLDRAQAAARRARQGPALLASVLLPPQSVQDAMRAMAALDPAGFRLGDHKQVRDILRQDQLRSALTRTITHQRKQQKPEAGGWPGLGVEALRQAAAKVCLTKSEARHLGAQVRLWLLADRLLRRQVLPAPQRSFDHKRNQVQFWLDYHGCPSTEAAVLEGRLLPQAAIPKSRSLPGLSPSGQATQQAAAQTRSPDGPKSVQRLPPLLGKGRRHYLKECYSKCILPMPLSFVVGNTTKLNAAGKDLTDRELFAIAEMLKEKISVEEVDLSSNTLLTDEALVPFLERLQETPMTMTLRRLSLSQCIRAGVGTIESTMGVLKYAEGLRHLDLSRVAIGAKMHVGLCEAIVSQAYLHSVNLAQTGLGGSSHASRCIQVLLSIDSGIRTLDLGWNTFGSEAFICLGEHVAESKTIKSLRISNCSSSIQELDPPIAFFAEHLAGAETLTHLDVSVNRVDFRTALVIEDGLQLHSKLRHLDLAENPLGVMGVRSVLRLLASGRCALAHVETEGCLSGYELQAREDVQVFCATNPGGRYHLNLARPYHRALLRMLCKAGERFKVPPDLTLQDVEYVAEELPYAPPKRDAGGAWRVPRQGLLAVTFSAAPVIEAAVQGVADDDFSGFLWKYLEAARLQPGRLQALPLFARWRELEGRKPQQHVYLDALCKDFSLSASCLEDVIRSVPEVADLALARLWPCLPGDAASEYLSMLLFPTSGRFLRTREKLLPLMELNVGNPTGRYSLDLAKACQHAVAQRLLLLDRWEAIVDRRRHRPDTSATGNSSRLRNERFRGEPFDPAVTSLAAWMPLPEHDELQLDYVSKQRPPPGCQSVGDEAFSGLLTRVHASKCDADGKLGALRSVSHILYVTCLQMRQLLSLFRTMEHRIEALVTLFTRIVDAQNDKLWRTRLGSPEELKLLQVRLGHAALFPFVQPEGSKFELNLAMHEQRLCLSMLRGLEAKEKSGANLYACALLSATGKKQDLEAGIPAEWDAVENVPTSGTFRASYRCAPEDRDFQARKDLARVFGGFKVEGKEKAVCWWTGLAEVPPDVVELVEFLLGRYPDLTTAFVIMDGAKAQDEVKPRRFNEALQEMGCRKFKSEEPEAEQKRIRAVFKYLDSTSAGMFSLSQWQALTPLWKECELSIRDFVHFVMRTFGGSLQDAWARLDGRSSGRLEAGDLTEAAKGLGYFGPVRAALAVLGVLDGGSVGAAEFTAALEKYRGPLIK